jgi:ATP-binding cassette subfamily F protein 3
MNSIAWLETFLMNYKGAVIIIAHDRYFLDRVVSKVVELEAGKSMVYSGNYTEFAEKKNKLRETQIHHFLNQQREIKHHEEVIEKLRSFNREKSIKRAESREKALEKTVRLDKPQEVRAYMHLSMTPDILLMDEPSIALDPRNRKNLISILNEFDHLKLIASHDLDFIWDTCNRVVLMDQGKIVADGPAEEILRDEALLTAHGLELPLSLTRRV